LNVSSRAEALQLLEQAGERNPGQWVQHSLHAAQAAEAIAKDHPALDAEGAYILGCLHDIGRREGRTGMRHILDGYTYLHGLGYEDAARVCLTHSYPVQNVWAVSGKWDCTPVEMAFIEQYITEVHFNLYDRLIQLCDALSMADGIVPLEKRFVNVALRYGMNQYTLPRWQVYFQIKEELEACMGQSIYKVLPGVVKNTFSFNSID
jgi:hypothetical protein